MGSWMVQGLDRWGLAVVTSLWSFSDMFQQSESSMFLMVPQIQVIDRVLTFLLRSRGLSLLADPSTGAVLERGC